MPALAALSRAARSPKDLDLRPGVWLDSAGGLVDRVIASQSGMRDLVARLADEGFPRQVDLVAAGYLEVLQARIDWSQEHRHLIEP